MFEGATLEGLEGERVDVADRAACVSLIGRGPNSRARPWVGFRLDKGSHIIGPSHRGRAFLRKVESRDRGSSLPLEALEAEGPSYPYRHYYLPRASRGNSLS